MKRIFVVSSDDESIFIRFVNLIKVHIPNVITINYYKDVLYESCKDLLSDKYTTNNIVLNKQLAKIEKLSFSFNKYTVIKQLIDMIEYRNSPRTIIFVLCNDRLITHHIRLKFGGNKVVKTVRLSTKTVNIFKDYRNEPFKHFDMKLDITEDNELLLKTLTKNFMTNIPVKWFIKNE